MQSQFESDCPICAPQPTNVKKTSSIILKLLKIIENEKKKSKKLVSLPSEQYFKQLVDYLKLDLCKNKNFISECAHKTLKNYITKKLGISLDQLYCLSEHIFTSLSKRKFELELIQKIAKNIHERAFQTSTQQKKEEAVTKNIKKLKVKNSMELSVPTVHSIRNQKDAQNHFPPQNHMFSKLFDHEKVQSLSEFQDPLGFCVPNYEMVVNSSCPFFYGPEFKSQRFSYSFEDIRLLMSSGYFMGEMGPINH